MGLQRRVNRGDPDWQWKLLRRLPASVPARATATVPLRLSLGKRRRRGYAAGVAVYITSASGRRARILLPEGGIICYRTQCPDSYQASVSNAVERQLKT